MSANQFSFKHSSRNLPLNDSQIAFYWLSRLNKIEEYGIGRCEEARAWWNHAKKLNLASDEWVDTHAAILRRMKLEEEADNARWVYIEPERLKVVHVERP